MFNTICQRTGTGTGTDTGTGTGKKARLKPSLRPIEYETFVLWKTMQY